MRKILSAFLFTVLGVSAASAESVFDAGRLSAPRFELGARESGFELVLTPLGEAAPSTGGDPAISTAAWSLLMPGLAQQKLRHRTSAKIYYGLEAVTWIAAGSFLYAGIVRERAYKDYAVVFAGVSGTDRPDGYWESIGEYLASDGPGGYNEMVRREARDLYYPDLEAMNAYFESNAYLGTDAWQWRSPESFYRYGSLRDDSRFAYRYAIYAVFVAAAIRIVSAADAVRLIRMDARVDESSDVPVSLEFTPSPTGAALCLVRSF
jgi:hypothetical protein